MKQITITCLLIVVFIIAVPIQAQSVTLVVDADSGTLTVDDLCPAARDAAIYLSIQAAVNCAQAGDTVQISGGVYGENVLLEHDLTLIADGEVTVDGMQTGRPLTLIPGVVASVQGVTVTNGRANFGGGVYVPSDSQLRLDGVTITGNTATTEGGGFYVDGGQITITAGKISDNISFGDASAWGGKAAQVTFDAATVVDGSTLTDPETTIVMLDEAEPVEVAAAFDQETGFDAPEMLPESALLVEWNELLLVRVKAEQLSPPEVSRIFAYTGITMYEAVQHSNENYASLSNALASLPELPQPIADESYEWSLVAVSALEVVATSLLDDESDAALTALYDSQRAVFGEEVPFNVFNRSHDYGKALGESIATWAANDNREIIRDMTYTVPTGDPSFWVPLEGQQAMEPFWGSLRPFALEHSAACNVPPGMDFSSEPGSEFFAQVSEVMTVASNATDEQRMIAQFWADNPGETATPPGHWIYIQNMLVEQLQLNLVETAQMYALTGVAMGDAFISAWDAKYHYQLLRPVTYINEYLDPEWETVVSTPPFPEYPSGHSVVSGAAEAVLTNLFGDAVAFTDEGFTVAPARSFTSFADAAQEAAMSRLYGGIHYRIAIENGLEQGRCVANMLLE